MYDEAIALHESGHATVADVLGRRVDVVTIEQGDQLTGCTWSTAAPVAAGRPRVECPLISWARAWQARLAADVAVVLAGDMAERMFSPRVSGRVPEPVSEHAAERLAQLCESAPEASDAEREQATAGVNDPGRSDAEQIAHLTFLAHGSDPLRAGTWLAWVGEETRALLLQHELTVRRMSGLLVFRGTIGAEAAAACLRAGEEFTMKCSQCGRGLPADDNVGFCPYCGTPVQGLTSLVQGGTSLSCPGCGTENLANAKFCKSCGRQLPQGWSDAAGAAQQAATSSSGRQPQWGPQQRRDFLDGLALSQERAKALALAPVTGATMKDAAAASDRVRDIESLWERLDDQARRQRAELGSWPDPADVAACRQSEADADQAWLARQAAVARRDQLERTLSGRTDRMEADDSARFDAIARDTRHRLWGGER